MIEMNTKKKRGKRRKVECVRASVWVKTTFVWCACCDSYILKLCWHPTDSFHKFVTKLNEFVGREGKFVVCLWSSMMAGNSSGNEVHSE